MIKVEYSRVILLQVIDNAHTDFLLSRVLAYIYKKRQVLVFL